MAETDGQSRGFAGRILAVNGLLLLVVLVGVALVARSIYQDARYEVIAQTRRRQQLLADETARGIENHYQSIVDVLDLMHPEEADEAATRPSGDRAIGRPLLQGEPVERVMWRQLSGRVSALFAVDLRSIDRPVKADSQLVQKRRAGGRLTRGADLVPPVASRVIGPDDARVTPDDAADLLAGWSPDPVARSMGPVRSFRGSLVNVICVPIGRGRSSAALVAVVPVRVVEAKFVDLIRPDPLTTMWLADQAGATVAASRAALSDAGPSASLPPAGSTSTLDLPFDVGRMHFAPGAVTAQLVAVANRRWTLYVETDFADVDLVVGHMFRRVVWWCAVVVLSVSGILVTTAVGMIRARTRDERLRHEALTRELGQARRIQLAWLPQDRPAGGPVDVGAVNQPASHISGDFYNWFDLPDGRLVITIGDVTGHGMAAAFLMATTQLLIRNTMARLPNPGDCLAEVNRQLCVQVFNGQFVTMLVLVLDPAGGHLEMATAGHPAPLMGDGESYQPLNIEPQLVLGVDPEATYPTARFDLPSEATLLLYTDGVVECPDATDARFGTERLRRCLYGRYESAQMVVDRVVAEVDAFRGSREIDDDLTMVALQLQPSAASTGAAFAI